MPGIPESDVYTLDMTGVDTEDPNNPVANTNGLTRTQRFILKNFFDTQPKKRKAYMNQLGYELKGETYRPLKSGTKFIPIEEDNTLFGIIPNPVSYFKNGEFDKEELTADAMDAAFDLVVTGPLSGAAAAKAGTLGAVKVGAGAGMLSGGLLSAPGALVGGIGGTIAGGAAGNAAAEILKAGVADFILDEDIPMDKREMMIQSLTAGIFAGGFRGAGDLIKKFKLARASGVKNMLKEATIRSSNGQLNDDMLEYMIRNPQKFTKEEVKGSKKRLLDLRDEMFGTSAEVPHTTRQLKGGLAKDKIESFNKRADLEIEKLSQLEEANFSAEEIVGILNDKVASLRKQKFHTDEQLATIKFIDDKIDEVRKKATKRTQKMELDPETLELNMVARQIEKDPFTFGETREFLKGIQNAAFEKGPMKDNGTLRRISHDLKEATNKKAKGLKSELPAINAARSRVLTSYKNSTRLMSSGAFDNAFIGKDSLSKQLIQRQLKEYDEAVGANMSKLVREGQFQATMESLLFNPKAFGSGSVLKDMVGEGARQARTSALRAVPIAAVATTAGVPAPMAAAGVTAATVKGFVGGMRRGASLSDPNKIVKNLARQQNRIDKLAKGLDPKYRLDPNTGIVEKVGPEVLGAGVAAASDVGVETPLAQPPGEGPRISEERPVIRDEDIFQLNLEGI